MTAPTNRGIAAGKSHRRAARAECLEEAILSSASEAAALQTAAKNKGQNADLLVITDTERKLFAVLFGPIVDKILSEPD
jgi:hypothetical protein